MIVNTFSMSQHACYIVYYAVFTSLSFLSFDLIIIHVHVLWYFLQINLKENQNKLKPHDFVNNYSKTERCLQFSQNQGFTKNTAKISSVLFPTLSVPTNLTIGNVHEYNYKYIVSVNNNNI